MGQSNIQVVCVFIFYINHFKILCRSEGRFYMTLHSVPILFMVFLHLLFWIFSVYLTIHGHSFHLTASLARNNIHNFFAVRIVPIWNSLPDSLVTSSTTSMFKSRAKYNPSLPHPAIFCQSLLVYIEHN